MNKTKTQNMIIVGLLAVIAILVFVLNMPKNSILSPNEEEFIVPKNTSFHLVSRNHMSQKSTILELTATPGDQLIIRINKKKIAYQKRLLKGKDFKFPTLEQKLPKIIKLTKNITVEQHGSVLIKPSRFNFNYMASDNPFLVQLQKLTKTANVIKGKKDEFDKFKTLVSWARTTFPVGSPLPYPQWNAIKIIYHIKHDNLKIFCGQYAQIMVQSLLSLGYPARYVGIDNHELLEVWSNQYKKWILLDPYYGCYYQLSNRDVPANALEVHQSLLRDGVKSIKMVPIVSTIKFSSDEVLQRFHIFCISLKTDHPLDSRPGSYFVRTFWKHRVYWLDSHTQPILAENSEPLLTTTLVNDLYAPLNSIELRYLNIKGNDLFVEIKTNTPDMAYIISEYNGAKTNINKLKMVLRLQKGENHLVLQTVTRAGIKGIPAIFTITVAP